MTKRKPIKPPAGLSAESQQLWRRIHTDYALADDVAGESLLRSLCETLDRLQQCQVCIKKDGLTVAGAQGQTRPHPLLQTEAECRRAILAHYRALKLEPEDY